VTIAQDRYRDSFGIEIVLVDWDAFHPPHIRMHTCYAMPLVLSDAWCIMRKDATNLFMGNCLCDLSCINVFMDVLHTIPCNDTH
jgi:hypothetical protein